MKYIKTIKLYYNISFISINIFDFFLNKLTVHDYLNAIIEIIGKEITIRLFKGLNMLFDHINLL